MRCGKGWLNCNKGKQSTKSWKVHLRGVLSKGVVAVERKIVRAGRRYKEDCESNVDNEEGSDIMDRKAVENVI